MLLGAGPRRAEAASLTVADFNGDDRALTVLGKGYKHRRVFVGEDHAARIDAWIARRGSEPGTLLRPISRAHRILQRSLSPDGVASIVRALVAEAGLEAASAHDVRRTYVSSLLDAGADLATVQRLVGHASPVTTARYDGRGERAQRAAVEMLRVSGPAA